jgi:hypothetical protein
MVETRVREAEQRLVRAFAYDQANLVRDGSVTQEQALAAIAERFPQLGPEQVRHAFGQGMYESMW